MTEKQGVAITTCRGAENQVLAKHGKWMLRTMGTLASLRLPPIGAKTYRYCKIIEIGRGIYSSLYLRSYLFLHPTIPVTNDQPLRYDHTILPISPFNLVTNSSNSGANEQSRYLSTNSPPLFFSAATSSVSNSLPWIIVPLG